MDLDANQEAFAIGAANAVAGFFSCFPSSGSFSRTTLNALNGARSPLSNISASVAVLACLWFFTPFLYYVPMSCLGGIIEASLVSLFEYKPFKKAWRISRPDFVVMCVTAGTTAIVNIEVRPPSLTYLLSLFSPQHTHIHPPHPHTTRTKQVGLCVGIFVSIAVLLQELSELRTSVMIPVPSASGRYLVRSQSVDPSVLDSDCDYVKVMRLTASLFFANQVRLCSVGIDVAGHSSDRDRARAGQGGSSLLNVYTRAGGAPERLPGAGAERRGGHQGRGRGRVGCLAPGFHGRGGHRLHVECVVGFSRLICIDIHFLTQG